MAGGRALHSVITDELAKGGFKFCHLVKLSLNSTYYYTDAQVDVSDGTNNYLTNAFMQGFSDVKEEGKMTTSSMTLKLSGVNQTFISEILNYGYIHKEVLIYKAFLNDTNVVLSSGSNKAIFVVFKGNIAGFSLKDDSSSSEVKFKVQNHWAYFSRIAGRITTPESQNQYGWTYTDKGFDWMTQVNDMPTYSSRSSFIYKGA